MNRKGLLFIKVVAFLLTACAPWSGTQNSVPLSVVNPEPRSSQGIAIKGSLEPRHYVELGATRPGLVDAVLVKNGDPIVKGAVIMRLDGYERSSAKVTAAELEILLAKKAFAELHRTAGKALAEATYQLSQAQKAQAYATDHLESLIKPVEIDRIDQAAANLQLADNALIKASDDLRQARQQYANKNHIIWKFINQRQFRLRLVLLERKVTQTQQRVIDAQDKYDSLLKSPDAIDVAVARAELAVANAQVQHALREKNKLIDGPDPDDLEAALARIHTAEDQLSAAQAALSAAEISSPITGILVDLNAKEGEWVLPGKILAVVADLSEWVVVSTNLQESDMFRYYLDQPVSVSIDAVPEDTLHGIIERFDLTSIEKDGDVFFPITIRLEYVNQPLMWGMTARIGLPAEISP